MSSEPKEELHQLERIADTGGSSETPLILLGNRLGSDPARRGLTPLVET